MKHVFPLLTLLILIAYFWQHPVLYPIKLLVVFFHEASHALMALITGGEIKEFVIDREQGGYVTSLGGNRFSILTAGYLGSLFWGVLIYLGSVYSHFDKAIMFILGLCIISITLFLSSAVFSDIFGILTAIAMMLSAYYLPREYNDFLLRLLGLTSMMYAPFDIYSDTISRSHLESDAYMLAQYAGGTTVLWGGLWIIVSLIVIYYCLKISLKAPISKNAPLKKR